MRFMQLGNGGGFDFDQVSSSFLIEREFIDNQKFDYLKEDIEIKKKYMLFDCGHGVISKLQEIQKKEDLKILENLDFVFISHVHEDHISNLSSLVLCRYFMMNKKTTVIYGNSDTKDFLQRYLKETCSNELKGGVVQNAEMYNLINIGQFNNFFLPKKDKLDFELTTGNHMVIMSNGLIIPNETRYSTSKPYVLFISGDTKAHQVIQDELDEYINKHYAKNGIHTKAIIFHDYSTWKVPSRNVHACDIDIEGEYSDDFIKSMNGYHAGDMIVTKWIDFDKEEDLTIFAPLYG